MSNRFSAIIFDFDYTLADSSVGVIASANFALSELGFAAATDEAIRHTIGLSLPETFKKLTGDQSERLSSEFLHLFHQKADEVMTDATFLFDSVPGVLEMLKSRDIPLGIVTSKFRYRIEEIMERERLRDHFDVIIGAGDVVVLKPDPQGLLNAVESLSSFPYKSLYVGDSVTDAETSRRANVPFAAVLSGVTDKRAFADYELLHLLDDISHLPSLVSGLNE